jgi:hypothetical protein
LTSLIHLACALWRSAFRGRATGAAWISALAMAASLAGCGGGDGGGSAPILLPPPTNTTPPPPPTDQTPARKALLIGISNISIDSLQKLVTQGSAGNFAKFSIVPAYTGGVVGTAQEQPTLTGPTWASILTGTWSDRHQVSSDVQPRLGVPSVFSSAKTLGTGHVVAASVGQNGPLRVMLADEKAAGSVDTLTSCSSDDCVAQATTQAIDAGQADLVFASFDGPVADFDNSIANYEAAIGDADRRLGLIAASIATRQKTHPNEDWLVVLTTDNGLVNLPADGLQLLPNKEVFIGLNKPANAVFTMDMATPATPTSLDALAAYPSVADIAPTLMQQLGLALPEATSWLEGSTLVGDIGVRRLGGEVDEPNAALKLSWTLPGAASSPIKLYRNGTLLQTLPGDATSYSDASLSSFKAGAMLSYVVVRNGVALSYQTLNPITPLETTLTDGLVHFFSMDTSLADTIVPTESFTALATATYQGVTGSTSGQALSIDPNKGGFRIADDLTGAGKSFTIGLWLRTSGFNTLPLLLNKDWWSSPVTSGVSLYINNGLNVEILDGVNHAGALLSVPSNQWVYVALTLDAAKGVATLYAGAQHQALASSSMSLVNADPTKSIDLSKITGTGYFALGDSPHGNYYNATNRPQITLQNYDDVAFWNRALSAEEVQSLQASGKSLAALTH